MSGRLAIKTRKRLISPAVLGIIRISFLKLTVKFALAEKSGTDRCGGSFKSGASAPILKGDDESISIGGMQLSTLEYWSRGELKYGIRRKKISYSISEDTEYGVSGDVLRGIDCPRCHHLRLGPNRAGL